MAANVLDVMAEYLPLVVQTRVSATTNPTTRIYSRSGAVLRENRTSEALPRCAESILDNGLDGCYDAQGVLGKIMRRRLEVFIPIVLLSILVQMVAPIAAFRMVAFAASDPVLAASICHDSAASADTQTAPGETQRDHGICCVLCAAGHGAAISVDPPPFIFVSLQRLYQRVSWLEPTDSIRAARVGSNTQARAPPQLT